MKRMLPLLPFMLFLVILPFPGTVAARLLLLAVCFGIAVFRWWRIPGARAPIPCKPALFLWAAVCTASLAYTIDFVYSASELKNELGYTMMAFFAFFVMAADRTAAIRLFRASGIGLAVIGSWAIAAWVANGFTWVESGRYGGIGIFSTYLVTMAPILGWLAFEDPRPLARRTAAGLLLFAVFLAFISMQRATWLAFAVQALILLSWRLRYPGFGRRRAAAVAAGVVMFTVASLQFTQHQRVGQGISTLGGDVRARYWPKAIETVVAHPMTGAGFGRQAVQKAYPELTPPGWPDLWHAHNVVLNYGLELGIPGLVALLALFGSFALLFWRTAGSNGRSASVGIAGLAIIAGVLARNQFNDFFVRDMSLLFWALLGILARMATTPPAHERTGDTA
jgi:O-antigen ligase